MYQPTDEKPTNEKPSFMTQNYKPNTVICGNTPMYKSTGEKSISETPSLNYEPNIITSGNTTMHTSLRHLSITDKSSFIRKQIL
jgi:hypothetical protein